MDPSCGAGSFLLAVADALVASGAEPRSVLGRLGGCDVDAQALARCRESLDRWAAVHGVSDAHEVQLIARNPLMERTPFDGTVDLVVGNPPFLAQRTTDTARDAEQQRALRSRFGPLGPYVDDAAAFLLVGAEMLVAGGVCVMVQPHSFLSARDSAAVRDRLLEAGSLVALWADDVHHFDADVEVCAPVLRKQVEQRRPDVELNWSLSDSVGSAAAPLSGRSWGSLLASAIGVPAASSERSRSGSALGDVATVTAGFRDEFYALAQAARTETEVGWSPDAPRLVTSGMIDVARLDGITPRRLAGRQVVAPVLDRSSLAVVSSRVCDWVEARSRPKALVATQTRVPEAVADPVGSMVPVTPVVSVEPHVGSGLDPWMVVAALSAPSVAVAAATERAGSGLSLGTIRLTASWLRSVRLPVDAEAWSAAALVAEELHSCPPEERTSLLRELGRVADVAHGGEPDEDRLSWWLDRADRRSRSS